MRPVRIAGVGLTPFGRHPDQSGRELFSEAAATAFDETSVPRADVDHVYLGNFVGEISEDQGHQAPLMTGAAGISAPATRVENACASGGAAVHNAVQSIRSGGTDVVVVGGVETLTALGTEEVTGALAMAADTRHEGNVGLTFPGAYALMARAYFETYGGTRRNLAHIAIKNHHNAMGNDYAHFHEEITVEEVLGAPTVADPLGLYDACPISDGAAVTVLVSEEYAASNSVSAPVEITGSGQGGDSLALQERARLAKTPATQRAAKQAYDDAGILPSDVDVAEVHDCFTIAEALAIEGLGFCKEGEGITAAVEGMTTKRGELPVNLSGGLKAKGHPVGATGVAQIVELTKLLRGDHHQSDAVGTTQTGVAHNAGGTVASANVHVLEVIS